MKSLFFLGVVTACLSVSYGMVCDFDQDNVFNRLTKNCPGLLDNSDNAYCCLNPKGEFYCCNFFEFAATYLIIGVVAFIVLSILCSCLCCLCCPCCWIYKRRHGGVASVTVRHVNHGVTNYQNAVPYYPVPDNHVPVSSRYPGNVQPIRQQINYPQQPPYNPNYS